MEKPWYINILEWIEQAVKNNWPALGLLLWGVEEKRVDSAKQAEKTAELKEKLVENENEILKDNAGLSDDDIINKFASGNKPKT